MSKVALSQSKWLRDCFTREGIPLLGDQQHSDTVNSVGHSIQCHGSFGKTEAKELAEQMVTTTA